MPVRLDNVPAVAQRPSPPNIWLWLSLLTLLLLLGTGAQVLLGTQPTHLIRAGVWGQALFVPFLGWCLLVAGRQLLYLGAHHRADGWDVARKEDLAHRTLQGRRSLQVLSASLFTALRTPEQPPADQVDALRSGHRLLTAQPSRRDPDKLCRSRLPGDADTDPKRVLLRQLKQILSDVSPALAELPHDRPLALLLEIDSGLSENQWRRVWRQAWSESAIRQPAVPVEGSGLAVIDHWLDQGTQDEALLLVVALRFAPLQPADTGEVAVGILLGNNLTQTSLMPIAKLHRPEQEREPCTEALRNATRQSLNWVPLPALSVDQVWQAGVHAQRNEALSTALFHAPVPKGHSVVNLDSLLGRVGKASPWLAVATATQALQRGAGPQLTISGDDCAYSGLWVTVITPPALLAN